MKLRILQYEESRMSFVAPNLSAVVGSTVAAKMMGRWGTFVLKIVTVDIDTGWCWLCYPYL